MAKEKTNPALAFGYGMGDVGMQMGWYMINTYITLFYTDIVGLSATAISFIMLIARVWDIFNDPRIGALVDKTNTRWGKFRPYLMFTPPFFAIFNLLTFTVFPVTGILKVIICLVCYVCACMLYTTISTSQGAILNVIAVDSQVRTNLASARGIGTAVIQFILSMAVMPMILFFGRSEVATAKGFFWTTLVLSLATLPCFAIAASICKEKYLDKLHTRGNAVTQNVSFLSQVRDLKQNDQLLMIVISTLFGTMCVAARMGLLSYYVIYVVGSYTMISVIFPLMTAGQFIGTLLIPVITPKIGKKKLMLILSWIMIVSFIVIFFFGAKSMVVLLIFSFFCGIANSSMPLSYGLVSDCIELRCMEDGQTPGRARRFIPLACFEVRHGYLRRVRRHAAHRRRVCAQRRADRDCQDRHKRGGEPASGILRHPFDNPVQVL